ncbi:MAG: hypothetical protein ABIH86_00105 [Planctomycetota bacterium]
MAKVGFFTHMFGGAKKKAEVILKKLTPPFNDIMVYQAISDMRHENVEDVLMITTMWEVHQDPEMIIRAAVVNKRRNFPNLKDDLVGGWPWGDDNLWKGFLAAAENSKAKAVSLMADNHPDPTAVNALIKPFCSIPQLIQEYIDRPVGLPPLEKLWDKLGRDVDELWTIFKKDRSLFDAVALLLNLLPTKAGSVIAMNLNISTMVEELIAKSPDQGGLFAKAINAMDYSLIKFWTFVLEFQKNDKKAAIRFVFINGQDLLQPMLLAVINDAGTSGLESTPTLTEIVAVFAEESGEEAEGEEILTAETVVSKLGWTGKDIWPAVTEYTSGNIPEAVMLISRHFPGQMDELVFKQMDMSYILQEIGEHFRGQRGRGDLFCKRNNIDHRKAFTGILEFAEDEANAVAWFSECYPRTAADNLVDLLTEDPNGAEEILAMPFNDQVIWLALLKMLECESSPEEAFAYVQKHWPFMSPARVAAGMLDDGYPPDEMFATYIDSTTGPLAGLSTLIGKMGITFENAVRVVYRAGEERKGSKEENSLVSDLCIRAPEISSDLVFDLLARRKTNALNNPDELCQFIIKTAPGILTRINGVRFFWEAFARYYMGIGGLIGEQIKEAVEASIRRDKKIEVAFEDLQPLAALPDATENPLIIQVAERLYLSPQFLVNSLNNAAWASIESIAQLSPDAIGREQKTALRMIGLDQEQIVAIIAIKNDPGSYFPFKVVADALGITVESLSAMLQ